MLTANPEGCNREICLGLDTPGCEFDRSRWWQIEAGLGFCGHLATPGDAWSLRRVPETKARGVVRVQTTAGPSIRPWARWVLRFFTCIPLSQHRSSPTERLTSNPNQCGGRPCIRGMRIRVKDVFDPLAAGVQEAEILADYPYLEAEDISACLAYAAAEADPSLVGCKKDGAGTAGADAAADRVRSRGVAAAVPRCSISAQGALAASGTPA